MVAPGLVSGGEAGGWAEARASAAMGIACIVGGVYVLMTVSTYPSVAQRGPRVVALLLILVALPVLLRDTRAIIAARRAGAGGAELLGLRDMSRERTGTVLIFTAYAAVFEPLGFLISSTLTMLATALLLGWTRPRWAPPSFAVISVALLYVLFVYGFSVRLP